MNRIARIALVASFIATTTFAQQPNSTTDAQRIALRMEGNGARAAEAVDAATLDRYTGRYDAADGVAFVVVPENEALTLEAPESWGLPLLRLHEQSPREFLAAEAPVRVTFELDADGNVSGLLLHSPDADTGISAVRTPFRQGVVTIHDIYEDSALVKIAASY